jgi:hypothetical protein
MIKLTDLISEFEELISSEGVNYQKMLNFLKGMNRSVPKNVIPPTIEFVTILRKDNPYLFYELRDHVPRGTYLYDLLRVDFPYEVAVQRLENLKNLGCTGKD